MELKEPQNTSKETDIEWKTGYPEYKGWYKCRIDGVELPLYLFICEMNRNKRYWVDEFQQKVTDPVEWRA